MMDKISERLGAATGVEIAEIVANESLPGAIQPSEIAPADKVKEQNLQEDYMLARKNLKEILSQSMNLVSSAVSLARESESARSYESLSTFLKTVADINKDLISLSESKDSSGNRKTDHSTKTTNNTAVFVGSTEELLSKLPMKIINHQD